MYEPGQYMAGKGRPRRGTWISACDIDYTVMLSEGETSLVIALFAESKMI